MQEPSSFKVVIQVERREDGGIRIWCDEVPGLILSHQDPQKVIDDIKPALEVILSEVLGYPVQAMPLDPAPAALLAMKPVVTPPTRRTRSAPLAHRRRRLEYAAVACPA